MKMEERLKKPEQFSLVYREGFTQVDRFLVLRFLPNQLDFSRFGISISKRVGKAVVRNRVKRLLREILRVVPVAPGWDIVLIARNPAAGSTYRQLLDSVNNLFARARIRGTDE